MKYIHLFEYKSEIIDIFKNSINWRFYNYLLEKLTKYEDMGFSTRIKISFETKRGEKNVYDSRTNSYEVVDNLIADMEGTMLLKYVSEISNRAYTYNVYIYKEDELNDDYEPDYNKEELYQSFFNEVSSKAELKGISSLRIGLIPKP